MKKALWYSRALSLTRHHHNLDLLVSRCSCESYTVVFSTTLEDVARLTMLSMFGEAIAMGLVLEENDKVKLRYLTSTMTASRTFDKST